MKPKLVTREGERALEWPTPILPLAKPARLPAERIPKARGAVREIRVPLSTLAHAVFSAASNANVCFPIAAST